MLGSKVPLIRGANDQPHLRILDESNIPASVDWRANGTVINPVKNQAKCGSCWSFSSTAAIESHHAIETGTLYSLSEQQMVDCSWSYGN